MSIKGLDAHLTSGPPELPDPTHWHVSRHSEDDDVFITTDFWSALSYAETELRDLAEFEYAGIGPMGEAGDYQGAYEAWKRSEDLDAVYQAVRHAGDQHSKPDLDEGETYSQDKHRAPLYQGYGGDERIMETALRAVERVNSESPLSIWECSEELAYVDDRGRLSDEDNGIPVHAEDTSDWWKLSR